MLKRSLDILISTALLLIALPIIVVFSLLIFLSDGSLPFYFSKRIGKNGKPFTLLKLRSMKPQADLSKVDTTIKDDPRITKVGSITRELKIDELPQFINVLKGDMSLVGPRPNVPREVALYSDEEKVMLSIRPGITDFASIIFSNLSERLAGFEDANLAYNQYIRPWKSELALLYCQKQTLKLDLSLLVLTGVSVVNQPYALRSTITMLEKYGYNRDSQFTQIALNEMSLVAKAPPGFQGVITSRDVQNN
jgi:lipopolysaccharide/colanic/teichoic acid biosynthesis glycosyltransferase